MPNFPVRYFASENLLWQEGHEVVPAVKREGDVFRIDGFRNFRHLPEGGFEGGYEARSFDIGKLSDFQIFSVPF